MCVCVDGGTGLAAFKMHVIVPNLRENGGFPSNAMHHHRETIKLNDMMKQRKGFMPHR